MGHASPFSCPGPPVDRRGDATRHDAVQHVFFDGLAVEVKFVFGPVDAVRPLAYNASEVARAPTDTLQSVRGLFDFPSIHLEAATRASVRCRLRF